jgi:hypothetical protein
VKFLREAFAKEYVDVMWVFWEVKITNVDKRQPYGCVNILGFCEMHSISSLDHANS